MRHFEQQRLWIASVEKDDMDEIDGLLEILDFFAILELSLALFFLLALA